jgi:hypothetical protein
LKSLPKHVVICALQCACSQEVQAVLVAPPPLPLPHLKGLVVPGPLPVLLLLHAATIAPPSTSTVRSFQGLVMGLSFREPLSRADASTRARSGPRTSANDA